MATSSGLFEKIFIFTILMKILFLIILFSYVCLNLMLQLFNISFYHCTDVIVHAYRFLDVIEPLIIALMLLCLMLGS